MKLAKDIFKDLIENFELIEKQMSELSKMQSMLDKELVSTYHEIETTRFSASKGYEYAKKIQEICQTRRIVKHELATMQYIKRNMPIYKGTDYRSRKQNIENFIERHNKNNEEYFANFDIDGNDIAI